VRIEQTATGVRAIYTSGGDTLTVTGDYLVCAIPLPVLRRVDIHPPISPVKRAANAQLNYMSHRARLPAGAQTALARSRRERLGSQRVDPRLARGDFEVLAGPGMYLVYHAENRANPWSLGAAVIFNTGQMSTFAPHLGTVEGRIHFAGEHTSPWAGWNAGRAILGQPRRPGDRRSPGLIRGYNLRI
jgi:monoamine oxidase